MKFARYLQETQTPEWKKAYIDYRGLKKKMTAIRRVQEGLTPLTQSTNVSDTNVSEVRGSAHSNLSAEIHDEPEPVHAKDTLHKFSALPLSNPSTSASGTLNASEPPSILRKPVESMKSSNSPLRRRQDSTVRIGAPTVDTSGPSMQRPSKKFSRKFSLRPNTPATAHPHPFSSPLPLNQLLPLLSPQEATFFSALDAQLDKIESFFLDREKEMVKRSHLIKVQVQELSLHRKQFYAAQREEGWLATLHAKTSQLRGIKVANTPNQLADIKEADDQKASQDKQHAREDANSREIINRAGGLDPDEYLSAKKALRKAVVENYRGLETLNNYRILNITGIRKALKKFEKLTRIPCLEAYMSEKVDPSPISSDRTIRDMMKDMEEIYSARFVKGDKKKAMASLKAGAKTKSHHFSTFRSGIMLGTAIPAFVVGLYESLQQETRDTIPGWDGLLFFYGILFIPVLFSILVGLNLLVWARSRINYTFIFELEVRTRLDYREYFELPTMLLTTLCYCFWFSFGRIGAPAVQPAIWPAIWLGFVLLVMGNPFKVYWRTSRAWLLRISGRLLVSGTKRVEFADFWMGDQFCSLVLVLSNLPLVICSYTQDPPFGEQWRKCGPGASFWPVFFVFGTLPLTIRVVQSIRRYADSKLSTHLINGGKYASGIVAYFFYFLWRHQGGEHNAIFAVWIVFNVVYTVYASTWDLLMDWSMLKSRATHRFLRDEVLYTDAIPFYYLAIVTNIMIRFIWVIYCPIGQGAGDYYLRTFIAGLLEVLRRWQWNFIRLENEHLGNMDQYRITREVPLPYSFNEATQDDDENDDSDEGRRH